MFGYVQPNIVIKTLWKIYETHLYVVANVAIKPNSQSLTKPTNASENNDSENDKFGQNFDFHNWNKIEEIIE